MSDQAAFEAHLDQHPDDWTHRLVYADWLDEHGHDVLADGQRWQAKHQKHPLGSGRDYAWWWHPTGFVNWQSNDRPGSHSNVTNYSGPLTAVMDGMHGGHDWGPYENRQEAEKTLAHALRKAGLTPEPQQMSRRGPVRRYAEMPEHVRRVVMEHGKRIVDLYTAGQRVQTISTILRIPPSHVYKAINAMQIQKRIPRRNPEQMSRRTRPRRYSLDPADHHQFLANIADEQRPTGATAWVPAGQRGHAAKLAYADFLDEHGDPMGWFLRKHVTSSVEPSNTTDWVGDAFYGFDLPGRGRLHLEMYRNRRGRQVYRPVVNWSTGYRTDPQRHNTELQMNALLTPDEAHDFAGTLPNDIREKFTQVLHSHGIERRPPRPPRSRRGVPPVQESQTGRPRRYSAAENLPALARNVHDSLTKESSDVWADGLEEAGKGNLADHIRRSVEPRGEHQWGLLSGHPEWVGKHAETLKPGEWGMAWSPNHSFGSNAWHLSTYHRLADNPDHLVFVESYHHPSRIGQVIRSLQADGVQVHPSMKMEHLPKPEIGPWRMSRPRRYSIPVIENPEGGLNPRTPEEQERASRVDLVTLPPDVQGANCGNCMYIQDGHCTHPEVNQPVNNRNCCLLWDRPGTVRPWKSREGFRQYARVGRRRHRYAAVDESQIHPDWHTDGVAPRLGRALRHIAGQESQYPESGELATVALAVGPGGVQSGHFERLGEALAREGHPHANQWGWSGVSRGIAVDKAVAAFNRHNGTEYPDRAELLGFVRKHIPDAGYHDLDASSVRATQDDLMRQGYRSGFSDAQEAEINRITVARHPGRVQYRRRYAASDRNRPGEFVEARASRYASYRSPQGGMLARGLYYPGGKFLPGGSGLTGPEGQEQPAQEDRKKPKKKTPKYSRVYVDPVTGMSFGAGRDDPAESTAAATSGSPA